MNFLNNHQEGIITSFVVILIIAFMIGFRYLIIRSKNKVERMKKLRSWETASKEIIWKVKEIKYILEMSWWDQLPSWNYINKWYLIIEWKDPINNKIRVYESEEYDYKWAMSHKFSMRLKWPTKEDIELFNQRINKYIKIGDKIKITVSLKNSDDYLIENIPNLKK